MQLQRWLCNILVCVALISLLSLLSACDSGTIPEVEPQDSPTMIQTALPMLLPTLSSTPTLPTAIALPDLAVRYPRVVFNPGTCGWEGGQITLSFDNIGVADTGPFVVRIEGQPVELGDGLPAGSSADASVRYENVLAGITALVDSNDEVIERDETNNAIGATFTPPPTCTSTPTSTATRSATPIP